MDIENQNEVETTEAEPEHSVIGMLNKIANDDNVGAKVDFEAIISSKLNAALDAKKQELAQSLYKDDSGDEIEAEEEEPEQEPENAVQ